VKEKQNSADHASGLQIALSIALIFVSAILQSLAAPGNAKIAPGQMTAVGQSSGVVALSTFTAANPTLTPAPCNKIAFESGAQIYLMNADGSNQTQLTNTGSNGYPSFSEDGSKIAFTSDRDGNHEIYLMNADGSHQTRLINNAGDDFNPSFSGDGSKIAFTSGRDGNHEIYVMNADGSHQTRLTNNAGDDFNPSFSGDGSKIAFESTRAGYGYTEIYVVNTDGSNQTRLTYFREAGDPSFSRDGSKIAFYSFTYTYGDDIYVMDADGSNLTELTYNHSYDPRYSREPSFSADGSKIAFTSLSDDGNREIYVMNADGSNQTQLTYTLGGVGLRHPSFGGCGLNVTVTPQPPNAAVIKVKDHAVTLKIQGLGPSLGPGGVPDPVLEIRDGVDHRDNLRALNNDKGGGSMESEITLTTLPAGTYTALEEGNCGKKGSGQIVVYERVSDGTYVRVGSPIPTMTGIDSDGDALPDEWEKNGMSVVTLGRDDVCYPGDVRAKDANAQFVDLPMMGAKVDEKDVFVHADWMRGGTPFDLKPTNNAMLRVMNAFAMAPTGTGQVGRINLHIDSGGDSVMRDDPPQKPWDKLSEAHAVPFSAVTGSFSHDIFGREKKFIPGNDILNAENYDADGHGFTRSKRKYTFHYALFANGIGCQNSLVTGFSPIAPDEKGNYVLLGLGATANDRFNGASMPFPIIEMMQSTFFMHELGHSLGLHHGGFDDVNFKPNYLSVMNYLFTGVGLLNSVIDKNGLRSLDYSRSELVALFEDNLQESLGIQDPEMHRTLWFTGPPPSGTLCPPRPVDLTTNPVSYNATLPPPALDWDKDRNFDRTPVTVDLNGNGQIDHFLFGNDDWSHLIFSGDGTIGVPTTHASSERVTPLSGNAGSTEPAIDEAFAAAPTYLFDEEINAPQDVAVVSPQTGAVPLTVSFNGTGSTAVTGRIARWKWDFGDGTTGSGPRVTHVYHAVGDYYAHLQVTDSHGHINLVPLLHHVVAATPSAQLANISTRMSVGTGDNVLIGGFIVQGTQPKRVLVRAIGRELTRYGVPNVLADPILELHDSSGALLATNDNWGDSPNKQAIIETTLAPSDGSESAIIASLPANNAAYTVIVRGANNTTGVGLVEAYDLDSSANSRLANISTRGSVQTGDNVMIGGFIVQGNAPKTVIVRAIGPELTQYGVPNVLADPTLEIHNDTGALIASNDNWQTTHIGGIITANQVSAIQNSGHAPTAASESAIIANLPPGNYTAIVRGLNNTTGVALVEVYELD